MKNQLPSASEFSRNLQNGRQNIILIGPSGVGKTEWQRSLSRSDLGFIGIEMDERIGNNPRMLAFLEKFEGADEAEKMGNAFGKPWENPSNYREKEHQFLEAEAEEMQKLVDELSESKNHIVDLTGSAIYCEEALSAILPFGLVVYLMAGEEQYEAMRKNFLADPKPVCWGAILDDWEAAVKNENPKQELPKLYAKLLSSRHRLYEEFADIIIPWEVHRDKADPKKPKTLIEAIQSTLAV